MVFEILYFVWLGMPVWIWLRFLGAVLAVRRQGAGRAQSGCDGGAAGRRCALLAVQDPRFAVAGYASLIQASTPRVQTQKLIV